MGEVTLDHDDDCTIAVTVTVRPGITGPIKTCVVCGANEVNL